MSDSDMRRVYFSRDERADPLLLAKTAIDEAIFRRAAARLKLEVMEEPAEDNLVSFYIDCPCRLALSELLTLLQAGLLPCLNVTVPEDEIEEWFKTPWNDHFSFDIDHED